MEYSSQYDRGHIAPVLPALFLNDTSYHHPDEAEYPRGVSAAYGSEPTKEDLDRLGRERPAIFRSAWHEVCFCYALFMSQFVMKYVLSGFNIAFPLIIQDLGFSASESVWPANACALVLSTFLLPFGRLADMYGGYPVYIGGIAWLSLWCGIAGFARNAIVLSFCRAFQGFGIAAFQPACVLLLGSTYPPGLRKNVIFCLYGVATLLGFAAGIFFAGLMGRFSKWSWFFWIGGIFSLCILPFAILAIPSDIQERRAMGHKMDWPGAILIPSGLLLVVLALDNWRSQFLVVMLVVGFLLLAAAICVEGWFANAPLLPFDIFRIQYMKPLVIGFFLFMGTMGSYNLYSAFYMMNVMGATPLQLVAWYMPNVAAGFVISVFGGFILHLVSGTLLIRIASLTWILAPLLFALISFGGKYWAWIFPLMLCETISLYTMFNIANIFISTSLPLEYQGLAGALVNSAANLGISISIAISNIIADLTLQQGLRQSYKNVFWFLFGCAIVTLITITFFVRIEPAVARERPGSFIEEIEQRSTRSERMQHFSESRQFLSPTAPMTDPVGRTRPASFYTAPSSSRRTSLSFSIRRTLSRGYSMVT